MYKYVKKLGRKRGASRDQIQLRLKAEMKIQDLVESCVWTCSKGVKGKNQVSFWGEFIA